MEANLQARVHALASSVREWASSKAFYGKDDDLQGWCAKASAKLFGKLKAEGILSEIHAWVGSDGSAHVYLVVVDHVVDVTATQFSRFRGTPVLIMHHREAQEHEFYQTVNVFHSVPSLREWQKKEGWPAHQVAHAK